MKGVTYDRIVVPPLASEFLMAQDDRFLTVQEVAEQMRVSNMTVYRLIKSGELAAARVGRSYRLRAGEVDSYLRRGDR